MVLYMFQFQQQSIGNLYGPGGAAAVAAQSNIYTGNIPTVSGESELGMCVLGGGGGFNFDLVPRFHPLWEWILMTKKLV